VFMPRVPAAPAYAAMSRRPLCHSSPARRRWILAHESAAISSRARARRMQPSSASNHAAEGRGRWHFLRRTPFRQALHAAHPVPSRRRRWQRRAYRHYRRRHDPERRHRWTGRNDLQPRASPPIWTGAGSMSSRCRDRLSAPRHAAGLGLSSWIDSPRAGPRRSAAALAGQSADFIDEVWRCNQRFRRLDAAGRASIARRPAHTRSTIIVDRLARGCTPRLALRNGGLSHIGRNRAVQEPETNRCSSSPTAPASPPIRRSPMRQRGAGLP